VGIVYVLEEVLGWTMGGRWLLRRCVDDVRMKRREREVILGRGGHRRLFLHM